MFETFGTLKKHLLAYRKTIEIPIIDEESYEKNLVMFVAIGEPRQIAGKTQI